MSPCSIFPFKEFLGRKKNIWGILTDLKNRLLGLTYQEIYGRQYRGFLKAQGQGWLIKIYK